MLLTISTNHQPATDLGYLLHKNPARVQTEDLSFGKAHVFYPEASPELCTAALLVEIDPVALVRGRGPAAEVGSWSSMSTTGLMPQTPSLALPWVGYLRRP